MNILKRPLKLWHGLLAMLGVLALGVGGTAIAVSVGGKRGISGGNLGSVGGYTYKVTSVTPNPEGTQRNGRIRCGGDKHATGGGVFASGGAGDNQEINSSFPFDGTDPGIAPDDGWYAYVDNNPGANGGANETFQVYVICKN